MTAEEYALADIKGWHEVRRDYDSAGNVAIRRISDAGGSVYIITAINGVGELKESLAVTSWPLAQSIRDALKGVWIGGTVAISQRQIDEVPENILSEIDVMNNPPESTGFIGGGRHG
jgi:hypothetical protein